MHIQFGEPREVPHSESLWDNAKKGRDFLLSPCSNSDLSYRWPEELIIVHAKYLEPEFV